MLATSPAPLKSALMNAILKLKSTVNPKNKEKPKIWSKKSRMIKTLLKRMKKSVNLLKVTPLLATSGDSNRSTRMMKTLSSLSSALL
jgi:hypothetical protein